MNTSILLSLIINTTITTTVFVIQARVQELVMFWPFQTWDPDESMIFWGTMPPLRWCFLPADHVKTPLSNMRHRSIGDPIEYECTIQVRTSKSLEIGWRPMEPRKPLFAVPLGNLVTSGRIWASLVDKHQHSTLDLKNIVLYNGPSVSTSLPCLSNFS